MHAAVARELFPDLAVVAPVVRHQPRLARHVLAHVLADLLAGHVVDVDAFHLAAALDQRQHRVLVAVAALRRLRSLLPADERLVSLDRVAEAVAAAQRSERAVTHRLADAMAQEPRAFERDPEDAI